MCRLRTYLYEYKPEMHLNWSAMPYHNPWLHACEAPAYYDRRTGCCSNEHNHTMLIQRTCENPHTVHSKWIALKKSFKKKHTYNQDPGF